MSGGTKLHTWNVEVYVGFCVQGMAGQLKRFPALGSPNLALPQSNCVSLGKSLALPVPQSSVRPVPSACLLYLSCRILGRNEEAHGRGCSLKDVNTVRM